VSVITVDLQDARPSVSLVDQELPAGKLSIFLSHASSDHDGGDEELIRAYVSRLWAEDWDSPDDSVYDEM
jgi:hypothetical protein